MLLLDLVFRRFSFFHLIPIILFTLMCWYVIWKIPHKNTKFHHTFQLYFSLSIMFITLLYACIKIISGTFDIKEDLPFHLCNFLTIIYPFFAFFKKRWLFGILYFWVLVGTFQAILTPDLKENFPHPIYFKYWIVHCGLVVLVLHALIVLKFKVYYQDLRSAIVGANVYLIFSIIINMLSGGNYFFSMRKPDAASLLDYLGPWPWYLFTGQIVMLILFYMYYLPVRNKAERLLHLNR